MEAPEMRPRCGAQPQPETRRSAAAPPLRAPPWRISSCVELFLRRVQGEEECAEEFDEGDAVKNDERPPFEDEPQPASQALLQARDRSEIGLRLRRSCSRGWVEIGPRLSKTAREIGEVYMEWSRSRIKFVRRPRSAAGAGGGRGGG